MAEMIFRKADVSEREWIMSLYKMAVGMPFCTWDEYYPDDINLDNDLAAGNLYVLKDDGGIIGAVSIVPENEMDDFDCWKIRSGASEIARVAVHPDCRGKGLSKILVGNIIEELKKRGAAAVHLSVAVVNIPARRLYDSMGFIITGEKDMYGNSYYLCEKVL